MAKITLNPILKSLHGRIGGVVFYLSKDREYVRIYVKGRNPDTAAQKTVRRTFGDAVKSWQALPQEERFCFNREAANLSISGYNLYISEYLKTRIRASSKPDSGKSPLNSDILPPDQQGSASVSAPFICLLDNNMPRKTLRFEPD